MTLLLGTAPRLPHRWLPQRLGRCGFYCMGRQMNWPRHLCCLCLALSLSFPSILCPVALRRVDCCQGATLEAYPTPDSFPKTWLEFPIDWKPSWDETLVANGNEALWRQALAADPALKQAVEPILKLRRIWLLEQLVKHFPDEQDKAAAAFLRVADAYLSLGDRTRACQSLKRLAEDFPERTDRAQAYTGILRITAEEQGLPAVDAWVEYALHGIESMIQAQTLSADDAAAVLARQQTYRLLVAAKKYAEARRWLNRLEGGETIPEWQLARAELMELSGQEGVAADLYAAAGNRAKADELRAALQQPDIETIGKPMPRDLEIHWNALEDKRQGGKSVLEDLGLVQQALKLAAESNSFWRASPSYSVQCWLAIDRMLRNLSPVAIKPFRKFQEASAASATAQIDLTADANAIHDLFRQYPWSISVHRLLLDAGEIALRANRPDDAFRAFGQVLLHADDKVLLNQAHVGAWFAMTELAEPIDALEEMLSAVPDGEMLSWRDQEMPAAEVKAIMRTLLPASAVGLPPLKQLPRARIELPAVLAADVPAAKGRNSVPQGAGALAVRHIEQSEDGQYFFGPRHVACYDAKTSAFRWISAGNNLLDTANGPAFFHTDVTWQPEIWRPTSLGSKRATAIGPRRSPQAGESVAPRAVYQLMFHNLREGTAQCDLAAFDTIDGRVLWRTMARDEWRDLEPLSEPSAAEGRVYVLAWDSRADTPCVIYLICLEGETGASLWKQPLGTVAASAKEQQCSLLSSAVTVHQGSAYVSTNSGILARCNARDGAIEWLRTYPCGRQSMQSPNQLRREGTAPLVVGERVFFAPRDHSGVIAIDRGVGELLWDAPLVPSDQIVGATADVLIVRGYDELAALDLASGKEEWVQAIGACFGGRAMLFGADIFLPTDGQLLRIAAATGKTLEELPVSRDPGAAEALLPDGTLIQLTSAPTAVVAPQLAVNDKPQDSWSLACANSQLVLPPNASAADGRVASHRFALLADRQLICVTTRPKIGVAWQTVLRDSADSVGFHGDLVVVARGAVLTAIEADSGRIRWTLRLPFEAHLVGGDQHVLFASDLAKSGKVASIDPSVGRLNWCRWFGEEAAIGDGSLAWVSLHSDSGNPPVLSLYWRKALFGNDGWRPGEMVVDAVSGAIQKLRPFLPTETAWPERIVFGDCSRTYVGRSPFPLRAYQSNFQSDAIAFVGSNNVAHFIHSKTGADLTAGWSPVLDTASKQPYEGASALFATASGCYVKRLQELLRFDTVSHRELTFKIPVALDLLETRTVLDLREAADTLSVISQEPGQPIQYDPEQYALGGLKDSTGKGSVTVRWLSAGAQIHHGRLGLLESGISPVATLLDGSTKEHYRPQIITLSGLNTLNWAKYNVFFYGLTGTATINEQDPQTCVGWDIKNPQHRTALIRGVNYMKFEGVSGDSFTLKGPEANYCAVQIVDASQAPAAGSMAASLGLNWSGGGLELGPNDRVGAEVAMAPWYNIRSDHGLTGGYQNHHLFFDQLNRDSGAAVGSQKIAIGPRDPLLPNHRREAAILEDALVVTDAGHVFIVRSKP